jgi:hypothetical protein
VYLLIFGNILFSERESGAAKGNRLISSPKLRKIKRGTASIVKPAVGSPASPARLKTADPTAADLLMLETSLDEQRLANDALQTSVQTLQAALADQRALSDALRARTEKTESTLGELQAALRAQPFLLWADLDAVDRRLTEATSLHTSVLTNVGCCLCAVWPV